MIRWKSLSSSGPSTHRLTVVAAACSALIAIAVPSAAADDQGYVYSAVRCTTPGTAVVFGSMGSRAWRSAKIRAVTKIRAVNMSTAA